MNDFSTTSAFKSKMVIFMKHRGVAAEGVTTRIYCIASAVQEGSIVQPKMYSVVLMDNVNVCVHVSFVQVTLCRYHLSHVMLLSLRSR